MPRPSPYTSFYQIVQGPGYVVVVMEAIYDARIIPVDGRPPMPGTIRLVGSRRMRFVMRLRWMIRSQVFLSGPGAQRPG